MSGSDVAQMVIIDVAAQRWEHGWELHVSDERGPLAVLPSRRLSGVKLRVRDYVAASEGIEPASIQVRMSVRFSDGAGPESGLDAEIAAVRAEVGQAERAQRDAAARSRRLALRLRDAGLSGVDIAVVLQVSPQRVSQLVRG